MTGDGSINCLENPESQEEFVSKLQLAELIVSLAILADNGSMVIKMFTFFETSSISMLYILNCCFRELHIFKPATSKEGNSEVYVIGLGFIKSMISDEIIEKMVSNFKDEKKSLLQLDQIPMNFQQEVVEAAKIFMNHQVNVIEGNIRAFKNYDKHQNCQIKNLKKLIVEEYATLYSVAPIREDQKLLRGLDVNNDNNLNVRVHSGSHSERITFSNLSRCDQLQVLFDRLRIFYGIIFEHSSVSSCVPSKLHCRKWELKPKEFFRTIQGRFIVEIVSSKFILLSLLKFFIELKTFLRETLNHNELYIGKEITIKGNHLVIDMEYFRRASSYESYEKDVTLHLLNFLSKHEAEVIIIEGLPLFTQFLVGILLYLTLFVFEDVSLSNSSGSISCRLMKTDGQANLNSLISIVSRQISQSKTLLGICDTKLIFSYSQEFFKSVVDYNNHLCLKFCSFYLNSESLT